MNAYKWYQTGAGYNILERSSKSSRLYRITSRVEAATKQFSIHREVLITQTLTRMAETNVSFGQQKPSTSTNSDLESLARTLITDGPFRVESTPRRVRALFGGQFILDTTSARHVWEKKSFPQFWVPLSAVAPEVLSKGSVIDEDEYACAGILDVKGKKTDRVLIFNKGPLEGLVRFEFKAMG